MLRHSRKMVMLTILVGTTCLTSYGQSPLSQAFTDMKSNDPATAQKAKDNLVNLLVQEMPNIERDTSTICNALNDSDAYVRLQATAVLQAIAVAATAVSKSRRPSPRR